MLEFHRMGRRGHHSWLAQVTTGLAILLWLAGLSMGQTPLDGVEPTAPSSSNVSGSVEERLRDLESKYSLLVDENRWLSTKSGAQSLGEPWPDIEVLPQASVSDVPRYDTG